MSIYHGLKTDPLEWDVFKDGIPFDPKPSQKVWNHSPDGFAWGYRGSGPAQLALALLLDVGEPPDLAINMHQAFKFHFVAGWDRDSPWKITTREILAWINERAWS